MDSAARIGPRSRSVAPPCHRRRADDHPASSDLTPAFDMCVRSVEYGVPFLWGDEHVEWDERERFVRYGEFRREDDGDDEDDYGGEEKKDDHGAFGGEVPVLSFMDDDDDADDEGMDYEEERRKEDESDRWLREAYVLDRSIREMSTLLRSKEGAYSDLGAPLRLAGLLRSGGDDVDERSVHGGMTDAERSELQSAAAAFAAGAANRIEKLRRSLPEGRTGLSVDVVAHRAGVVACLLARLKSDVADRMGRMNAARGRASLDASRRPFAVRMPPPSSSSEEGGILGEDEGPGGRMPPMPSELAGRMDARREEKLRAFREAYADDDDELTAMLVPPKLLSPPPPRKKPRTEEEWEGARESLPPKQMGMKLNAPAPTRPKLSAGGAPHQRMPAKAIPVASVDPDVDPGLAARYGETAEERESYVEDLQRESAYLTAKLHSELDDVRKVEVRMTEITTLLTQFSDLVQEQQTNVIKVSESTKKSKDNVEKGQEQLVKAAEKGKESKHRMATFIVILALVMLFLNYITP